MTRLPSAGNGARPTHRWNVAKLRIVASRARWWRIVLPGWLAGIAIGSIIGSYSAASAMYIFGRVVGEVPVVFAGDSVPLAAGRPAPEIAAAGWINGDAPSASELRGKVLVIDLWADWCPVCREAAPMVVRVQERFEPRGVEFISLTLSERLAAETSVEKFGIAWRFGYEAAATISSLVRGLAAPTLFVIGADGTVVWNDGQARYRHQIDTLEADLSAAIERACGAATASD
jgi:thiol-disulfide isomerase/thioredoxin